MNKEIKEALSNWMLSTGLDLLVGIQLLLDFEQAFLKARDEQEKRKQGKK